MMCCTGAFVSSLDINAHSLALFSFDTAHLCRFLQFAHIGGLFYGICVGIPLMRKLGSSGFFGGNRREKRRRDRSLCGCRVVSGMVAIALFASTAAFLWRATDHPVTLCKQCRYITCVPFPWWKGEDKWWHCDDCDIVQADLLYSVSTTYLEISCPFGDLPTIDLMVLDADPSQVVAELPTHCRNHCEL